MKFSALLLSSAFALSAFAAPVAAKDWKTATITLEGAYAPWNMTNADGTLGGFEPELAKVLCERAKIECKLVASDWDGMIPALNAGKFDVIMDALSITEDRKKVIGFTIPYAATPAAFATAKDSPLANAAGTGATIKMTPGQTGVKEVDALKEAFKGKTIGIQAATVYAKFVYDNFGDIAEIREYKTGADRDLDLQNGRIDLGFDDAVYFANAFQSANDSLAFTGPEIVGPIWGEGEGLGVRQADTDLRDKFNEAIKSALADGTVKNLSMKWFKVDVSPQN
ncbi:octopine/nopaline transport system substrate-binding protein [Rhizobium tibeticum]|uniref:Amino acid ABC transporter substrate-binding protein, PAAT family n=2 Tax=Rhizobium TaxID=379 RepID=A0A1H8RPW3_9HYPH|nr:MULTISPECIES: transporter substrate-binding domain-containing protein [Rhizobium]MCA0805352.1 transporter substrate-binding domain-containing protein [Rhizobium sp. T1473]MCS0462226.1 transporter substrate-binding domain-containing protein [Rhizobium favelukesii]MDP9810781.1 octopine/nopaline transport system substrate-binding protein [Rhizobium tibeticum]UFS79320.1 transporter substrate-binding domain-containing protein [Rhizobium sp. T136]CDM62862.1 Octopine-binding periplasmic protein [R